MIIIIFAVVSFGLAFPYLLLCYAPSLMRFLPKPGAWMEHFKVSMGFLLMATVIWLFSVLVDQTGSAGVIGVFTLLLFLSAALYTFGKSWYSEKRGKGLAWAAVMVGLGVYLGFFYFFDITDPKAQKREYEQNLRLVLLAESGGGNLGQSLIEAYSQQKNTSAKPNGCPIPLQPFNITAMKVGWCFSILPPPGASPVRPTKSWCWIRPKFVNFLWTVTL